ncbi:hypothetical protein RND71_025167 [Anisodus tanguticus]|uniref:Ribosomal RNA small subunit methyltransferase H n=1 Tax=Anisodus tanguticus TaxID=243964 RepID=A0AAE1RSF4_9SOLA|nr:hypothetical protein RND71_025167 [Anisodus tanguticus]
MKNALNEFAGRQGWIKTATRVFQALRIAVNDELKTLEDSIRASFESLSSGGRLAVISFHSLEDRIVKQAYLNIMNCSEVDRGGVEDEEGKRLRELRKITLDTVKEEAWVKQFAREKKKAKRNIIVRVAAPVEINIILPIEFKNVITKFEGCLKSTILVIQKTLFETDVKPAEGRISIPQNEVTKFLET